MKEKEKIKQTRANERYKTRMTKLMNKYGVRDINEWVKKNPNTLTRLTYELYLEEEGGIARRQTWAYIALGIALVLMVVSFFVPMFFVPALLFLFVSSDMQTNLRIDRLEQKQWRDMVYNMYRAEKEEKNDKKHSKV